MNLSSFLSYQSQLLAIPYPRFDKKAVFPVAGLGTRFLPATKGNPKEMRPAVDKPLIQDAAEETVEAGVTQLVFSTGRNKRAISDHFDKAYELEAELEKKSKFEMLEAIAREYVTAHGGTIKIVKQECTRDTANQ